MLVLRGMGLLIFLLLLWQGLILIFDFPSYILPSPLQVAASFVKNSHLLLSNLMPTAFETLLGLLLGILLGMGIALLMISIKTVRYWLLPVMIISQAIPTFAVAPMLVVWFGYGLSSKIVTIMLMLFFPVASTFYSGLNRTPGDWLDMAKIMNGKKIATLWQLRFPAALPELAAGIRVATVLAPIGAIVSEWVGASGGLGFLMLNANARLEIDLMFACLITIMMLSLLIYLGIDCILNKIITW